MIASSIETALRLVRAKRFAMRRNRRGTESGWGSGEGAGASLICLQMAWQRSSQVASSTHMACLPNHTTACRLPIAALAWFYAVRASKIKECTGF
jgi:hypothetical protein